MEAEEAMKIKSIKEVVTVVTATPALTQSLKHTLEAVEREILAEADTLLPSKNSRAVAEMLKTGSRDKIANHLREEDNAVEENSRSKPVASLPDDPVIFRVTGAMAFSQPLRDTLEQVEEAIVFASCIFHGCDETAVRNQLKAGFERVHPHFARAKEELQQAGWPVKR